MISIFVGFLLMVNDGLVCSRFAVGSRPDLPPFREEGLQEYLINE